MNKAKIKYMSPEQIKYINTNLIDYVTMKTGSIVKVGEFQESPSFIGQANNYNITSGNIFRGGKKTSSQEENINEVELEAAPEGEKKQILRGPDGKLLTDILTGGDMYNNDEFQTNQNQQEEYQGQIPQEQIRDQYYDGQQQSGQEQYVSEENEDINDGYQQEIYNPNQYYPTEQATDNEIDNNIQYIPTTEDNQNLGVQEEYVQPNLPNDTYPQEQPETEPQQQEENIPPQPMIEQPVLPTIPIETPVIPIQRPEESQQPFQPQKPDQLPNQSSMNLPYQTPIQGPMQTYQPTMQNPIQTYQPPMQNPMQTYQPSMNVPMQPSFQPIIPKPMLVPFPQYIPPGQNKGFSQTIPNRNMPMVIPASISSKQNIPVQPFIKVIPPTKIKQPIIGKKGGKVFRARRKEVNSNLCPYCLKPK